MELSVANGCLIIECLSNCVFFGTLRRSCLGFFGRRRVFGLRKWTDVRIFLPFFVVFDFVSFLATSSAFDVCCLTLEINHIAIGAPNSTGGGCGVDWVNDDCCGVNGSLIVDVPEEIGAFGSLFLLISP